MLYIHQLNHLSPKMVELESVYLIRELREKTPYPLQEQQLHDLFHGFFVSNEEISTIENGFALVESTIEQVKTLLQKQLTLSENVLYETINLQRAIQMLKSFPLPLRNNLTFLQEFQVWQQSSPPEISLLLNRVPHLKTKEEKIKANEEIKNIFRFLLRNSEFFFNCRDIVNEGQVATASGLQEGLEKGFFFHMTLEEETKKLDYSVIRSRIPTEELKFVGEIERNIESMKSAIDTAYKANMRIVNFAVILYAYVKWLAGK